MTPFILPKKLDIRTFETYINPAQETNQFANGGQATRILEARAREMLKISDDIREGKYLNIKGQKFKNIVNIGIGGSRNGSELIYDSLKIFSDGPKVFYISSLDSSEFNSTICNLNPNETLFIVVSKTFKTIETIQNAKKAIFWLKKNLNCDVSKHLIFVTSNKEEVKKFFSGNSEIIDIPSGLGGRFG